MKWKTLAHNGVAFPPEYQALGFGIKIKGKKIKLNPQQEEMAFAWAKKKDTPYVQDPVFAANFMGDFIKLLPPEFKEVKISDIDFGEMNKYIDGQKALVLDKEAKKTKAVERKKIREEMKAKYGWAEVDGVRYDVANWLVEPPGIFMGRGQHPMRGKWKPRIYSEDVTLNLGKDVPVPQGKWKKIVHDNESTWLARWMDKLSDKEKYVWLSDASKLRQERDKAKYDKASKLREHFEDVIGKICKSLNARDTKDRMVATACYLIYKLAMRVGDEKDPDEADTVGASTLRVEHLKFGKSSIEFDFLGKDSVRWQKTLEFTDQDRVAFDNLQKFSKGKDGAELVFSDINSRSVNKFLGEILGGLTAKVFRTCLATEIVRDYLVKAGDGPKSSPESIKIICGKRANLQAAIACNHKRAIPKNFELSLEKKREALKKMQSVIPKTDKQAAKQKSRVEKAKLQLDLTIETKDYALNTSLRNYIDPRIYMSWCNYVDLDWTKIYTATLQRKFMWARTGILKWEKLR